MRPTEQRTVSWECTYYNNNDYEFGDWSGFSILGLGEPFTRFRRSHGHVADHSDEDVQQKTVPRHLWTALEQ